MTAVYAVCQAADDGVRYVCTSFAWSAFWLTVGYLLGVLTMILFRGNR